jgi:hypothetical protein
MRMRKEAYGRFVWVRGDPVLLVERLFFYSSGGSIASKQACIYLYHCCGAAYNDIVDVGPLRERPRYVRVGWPTGHAHR